MTVTGFIRLINNESKEWATFFILLKYFIALNNLLSYILQWCILPAYVCFTKVAKTIIKVVWEARVT